MTAREKLTELGVSQDLAIGPQCLVENLFAVGNEQ